MSSPTSNMSTTEAYGTLAIDRPIALVDDKISIRVTGLKSKEPVTLAASVSEKDHLYISHGHYTSDDEGTVDLTSMASRGGSYQGMESMGLFWSMVPARGQKLGTRLVKRDVKTPFNVKISVQKGHVDCNSFEDCHQGSSVLDSQVVERWYMAPGVKKILIRDGKLRGALFLPPGEGPFPGVIDMFGTAGGLIDFRAALLASRGFAALALPYFDYEDLTKHFVFQLEYFEEAVDWLSSHPLVIKPGIGVIGVSMGAEFAMYMPIISQKVIASVPINGYYYYATGERYKGGIQQPTALPDWEKNQRDEHGTYNFKESFAQPPGSEEAVIPIEKASHCDFLFIYGEADGICGLAHANKLIGRLQGHGQVKGHCNYRLLTYPGAGHMLEPPYTPLSNVTYHKVFKALMDYGGEPVGHAKAQEDSWKQILDFLHAKLDNQTHAKL